MEKFLEALEDAVNEFKKISEEPIRIVSHLDSDGLAAASILIRAFKRDNIKFSVSIVKQLEQGLLDELKKEDYKVVFFIDLGSGYLNMIERNLIEKKIFVLDHHKPEAVKKSKDFIVHVNPHLYGIDGAREISGSGVVYLFAKIFNEKNKDLAYLAVIGAIGDVQEYKGFLKWNKEILNDAVESRKIEVKKGLRMFGMQTKPLHRVLELSTDPYIPNVTGSEEGALRFLQEIGIEPKENGKWKKLVHLNNEDMKKLITAIILERLGSEEEPEDVLGDIYILADEEEESPTKDAKEFSTLLNATGRLNKPSLGIGTCLGSNKIKQEAIELLSNYRKELINALDWFYQNRATGKVIEKKGYVIVNAEDSIRDTLIGTLASIISKSNFYSDGTIIVGMAHTLEEDTKVSIRVAGFKEHDVDLREIIKMVVKRTGGEGGGHFSAAGAIIPQEREGDFINIAEQILSKIVIEERVK